MRTILALALFLAAACSGQFAKVSAPKLEALWTASGFESPEGVAAAPGGGWFISNVVGEGAVKDGAGYVSILAEDGTIAVKRFAEGFNAPKGMAVLGGALYVADIDRMRVLDAETGEAIGDVAIDGAIFLNDVAAWRGDIYVSDSRAARIYRIRDGVAEIYREGEDLNGVNGLLGDGDRLLVSTMSSGSLFEAAANGGWRRIASGMENADGVGLVPGGGYLVSSWPGQIFYIAENGATRVVLDTRESGTFQNDLSVFGDVVIVPNWMPGTVTAWRVVP